MHAGNQSRSPSLRSLGRKRRLWDNPCQKLIWLVAGIQWNVAILQKLIFNRIFLYTTWRPFRSVRILFWFFRAVLYDLYTNTTKEMRRNVYLMRIISQQLNGAGKHYWYLCCTGFLIARNMRHMRQVLRMSNWNILWYTIRRLSISRGFCLAFGFIRIAPNPIFQRYLTIKTCAFDLKACY
jgi:hypothetical protein